MSISLGTQLGPYKIVSLIGAGGMGEVYRAHDTRLNRDVALKVLPEVFARDAQRMARFEREAKLLATLNHLNIAAIYGLEESSGFRALVMELVEGPTLADSIKSGPIPVEEALPIAKQIADAVEYAHEQSVIHRDLKPANIKVKENGTVKVLDFGLAKALSEESAESNISNSPTLSIAATRQGVILGTAAYMSPEQARGKKVDKRTDIWAFGAVLYEMLTGNLAFHGDDVSDILAAVIRAEPDWSKLPADTPNSIRTLLRRCLRKDRSQRLGDAGAARIEIEDALAAPKDIGATTIASAPSRSTSTFVWATLATLFFLTAIVLAFMRFRAAPPVSQTYEFQIAAPPNTRFSTFRLSPDGLAIVFIATAGQVGGSNQGSLWIRTLDSLEARQVPGADGSSYPFWSPDSAFVGYFQGRKLKKVALKGGPSQTICDVVDSRGGAWGKDGTILFADGPTSPISRVSSSGGKPAPLTKLSVGEGHRSPEFLPDGRHFLFLVTADKSENSGVFVGTLNGSAPVRVLADQSTATYSADPGDRGGHLLFLREGTLMAIPFDAAALRTTGDAFPVAENVPEAANNYYGAFSSSAIGSLAYSSGAPNGSRELVWIDRSGKRTGTAGMPEQYTATSINLSPDQKTVAISQGVLPQTDIWLIDLSRANRTRFTFGQNSLSPRWTPDGSAIIYSIRHVGSGVDDIVRKTISGGNEEILVKGIVNGFADDVSPDGKQIVYEMSVPKTGFDLGLMSLDGNHQASVYLATPANERLGRFSPDGKWIAYQSDESGRYQVYAQAIPAGSAKYQLSTAGGTAPAWRQDGKELFFLSLDQKIVSVPVSINGGALQAGTPKELFTVPGASTFTLTRDGERLLVNLPAGGEAAVAPPITVVTNWLAASTK